MQKLIVDDSDMAADMKVRHDREGECRVSRMPFTLEQAVRKDMQQLRHATCCNRGLGCFQFPHSADF